MNSYEEITGRLDWALMFQRTTPSPLDRTSMFSSYADAQKYAAGNYDDPDSRELCGTSYVGQEITVYENGVVTKYMINADRKLAPMMSAVLSEENPTLDDYNYELLTHWINVNTEDVFLLVSVKGQVARWKSLVSNRSTQSAISTISSKLSAGSTEISIDLPDGGQFLEAIIRDDEGSIVFTDMIVSDTNIVISISDPIDYDLSILIHYFTKEADLQ